MSLPHAENLSESWLGANGPHWQALVEEIPHIVWMASPEGRVEFLNQEGRDYLGWSVERTPDHTWRAVIHPDDGARMHRAWLHAVRTQTHFMDEYRLRRADGEYRWHRGRGTPVGDVDGIAHMWIGTATDIDDHKRSKGALRDIDGRLEEAQRLANVGSWYTDVVLGSCRWSAEMYRLLGCELGQVRASEDRLHERVLPSDAASLRAVTAAKTSQPEAPEVELRFVLPDGGLRWLAIRSEAVRDAAGLVVGRNGTAQDVTERKLAEEWLRFQAHLLDAVGEAVIATDPTGTVMYWGPGAEELYGWKAAEADGRVITDLIAPVEGSYDPAEAAEGMLQGKHSGGMRKLARRDGSAFTAQVTRTSVHDAQGQLVGIIATSSDVSEREEAHAELDRARRTTAETLTLLGALQEEAPVGFGFVDRDLRYVRLNHELASMIGAPADEILGRTVAEVVGPVLWQRLEPVYRRVMATGEAVRNRPVIDRRLDGKGSEWLVSHYPVRVDDEIIGTGIILHDVTERARSEGFRSAVIGQVVDGVYTQDCEGRLTYMNSAASKLLGWTETELRGQRMHDVVHFQTAAGTRVGIDDCALLTHGQHGRLERSTGEVFTRKDGSTFPVAYSSAPLCTGDTVEGVAVVFCDVSEPGTSRNVIRVLIVESDRTATASFQALLDRHEGIEVVAVATTSASAMEAVERWQPHVVLLNAELSDFDPFATTTAIKSHAPSASVILMTKKYSDAIAVAGLDAGCAGVLDKSRAWVELAGAVRAAYHGETIISPEELQRVLSTVRNAGDAGSATRLTDREGDVLACMREGLSNVQTAERLGVAANTVRNHVQRILYKLNVHSKLEAVVLTSHEGLLRVRL